MTIWKDLKFLHPVRHCLLPNKPWIYILLALIGLLHVQPVCSQCQDNSQMCSYMASQGECEMDPEYMLEECPKSCENPCKCVSTTNKDTACDCLVKAKEGYCEKPESQIDCATTCERVTGISCPPLPLPQDQNAHLSTWSTQYLTTVTELCNTGFKPVVSTNKGQQTCTSDGTWQRDYFYGRSVECRLLDCGDPPDSPNTFNYYTDTVVGNTTQYSCISGYVKLGGQETIVCNANGTWEGTPLTCRRIDCGPPPSAANADVKYTYTHFGDKAQYTCSPGYQISQGDTTLTCGNSETWEGTLIVCTFVDCGTPPASSNTILDFSGSSSGDTANYTCAKGYMPVKGQPTLTCNSSGIWDGELLTCSVVDCGNPPASSNTILDVSNTTSGNMANYTCAEGYVAVKGQTALICNTSGIWEGELLTCSKLDCGPPPMSPNAIITANETFYGDIAYYTCATGYEHSQGDTALTCGTSGSWEGNIIVCTIIDCQTPPTSAETTVQVSGTTHGHAANYSCRTGYTVLSGDSILTCEADGKWTGTILTCTIMDCGIPPSSPNTNIDVSNTTYGSMANYTCAEGYLDFQGQTTLTCNASGLWDGELRTCSKIDCGHPPTSPNANTTVNNTLYGDTAYYACATGYEHDQGDTALTCGTSGSWEGNVIVCTIIDCLAPPSSPHTKVQVSGTTYGHVANYSCMTGYTVLSGDSILTCGMDGQWTGTILTCTIIDCGSPPVLPDTLIDVAGTLYNQTANYTCAKGYEQTLGQPTLTCDSSGKWAGDPLVCQIIDCHDPPSNPSISVAVTDTTYNQTAQYTCAIGYKYISGDSTLVCDVTGSWVGQLMTCIEKDCGPPNVRNLSNVAFTSTTYGSLAVYTCQLGHEGVDGDVKRTCQDNETWSGNALICLPVVCGPPPVFAGARMWTLDGEGHHKYKDRAHYECYYEEEGREGMQWTLECGPNKLWIGQKPQCGAANPNQPEAFHSDPVEAPASWAIGLAIFCILATFIVLFIVLDLTTLKKHSKYMKKNVKNFKKGVQRKWSSFRAWAQWKPSTLKPEGLVPLSPSAATSLSPSMMSVHVTDHSDGGAGADSGAASAPNGAAPLSTGLSLPANRSAVSLTSLGTPEVPETALTSVE